MLIPGAARGVPALRFLSIQHRLFMLLLKQRPLRSPDIDLDSVDASYSLPVNAQMVVMEKGNLNLRLALFDCFLAGNGIVFRKRMSAGLAEFFCILVCGRN